MRWFLLLAVLVFAGCDTSTDDPVVFQGVALGARGDASLAVENGTLIVSGLDGARSGGFTLDGTPGRVDVEIDPLAIEMGDRFGITVEDESGGQIASFYNVGQGGGRVRFEFEFADAFLVSGARVTYRLGGRTGQAVLDGFLDFGALGQGRLAQAFAGEGEGQTGSTHVVRERGRYVVVSDSNGGGARTASGCAGFLVTPPASFDFEGTICTDWIEVEPIGEFEMPQGTVSVTARGVGSFTVNDLNVAAGGTQDER